MEHEKRAAGRPLARREDTAAEQRRRTPLAPGNRDLEGRLPERPIPVFGTVPEQVGPVGSERTGGGMLSPLTGHTGPVSGVGAVQAKKKSKDEEARAEAIRARQIRADAMEGDRSHLTELYGDAEFAERLTDDMGQRLSGRMSGAAGTMVGGRYTGNSVSDIVSRIAPEKSALLDPVVRDSIRRGKVGGLEDEGLRAAVDDEMNHRVMADSMKLVDPAHRADLTSGEISGAEQAGRNLAHIMLAMQLGRIGITRTTKNAAGEKQRTTTDYGDGMTYDPSMASLLSYGGRVNMNFGRSTEENGAQNVYESMMELDQNRGSAKYARARAAEGKRLFATHHLAASGSGRQKETHGKFSAVKGLLSRVFRHRSFNPAIGGAGQLGYRADDTVKGSDRRDDGHVIKANGQNGHMYMGILDSGKSAAGGMMVGLETSGAGQKNLMGKKHDAKAAKSPFSAVGAHKAGRIGDEYGGRQVDLTGISMNENIFLQQMLTTRLALLAQRAGGADGGEAREQYNSIMERLSGTKLSPEDLASVLAQNGAQDETLVTMIRRAQNGGGQ